MQKHRRQKKKRCDIRVREDMATKTEGRVVERFEDAMMLALKIEEKVMSRGMLVASRS